MTITSLTFVLFLLAVFVVYYLMPGKWQWVALLAASIVFYAYGQPAGILYILFMTAVIYGATRLLEKNTKNRKSFLKERKDTLSKEQKAAFKKKCKHTRRTVFVCTVVLIIAGLISLKYLRQIFGASQGLFQSQSLFSKIVVPLGISYYTLMAIGYMTEVYWENYGAEGNYFKLLLFFSFFPHITQGPISDYETLAPQLYKPKKLDYQNVSRGFQRLIWGLFKKMLIADVLSPYIANLFSEFSQYAGISVLIGAVLYMVQLYADFSGYMDIMCGYCEMLGIQLAENFKTPFFSRSVSEFWRRWHITLGEWLRKYIYYPIALSNWGVKLSQKDNYICKKLTTTIAVAAVWIITGLWHGAKWTFLLWGAINGVIIIASNWLEPFYEKVRRKLKLRDTFVPYRAFQMIRTFLLILFSEIFAISDSVRSGCQFIARIFTEHTIPHSFRGLLPFVNATSNFTMISLAIAAAGMLLMIVVSCIEQKKPVRDYSNKAPLAIRLVILTAAILLIASFGVQSSWSAEGFMYANF